jgi:FkbM family methyltransferase
MQPHITSLNFGVSNVSGIATFYEADFTEASSLSEKAIINIGSMNYKEETVMTISMSDLCHKYFRAKPHLLSIDVEGIGEIVLRSNDWSNDKCIPDIIYAEDSNPNQRAGFVNLS